MSLYKPQHEAFVRFCVAKAYGIMEVEDLVNETIAAVFSKFENLKSEKAFLSYLFSTASNICKNEIRKKKIVFYESEFRDEVSRISEDPQDERVDVTFLYKALNLLPAAHKEALILYEINGLSIKEIASLDHSSVDAIKQRLRRGRIQLAELLGDKESSGKPVKNPTHGLLKLLI